MISWQRLAAGLRSGNIEQQTSDQESAENEEHLDAHPAEGAQSGERGDAGPVADGRAVVRDEDQKDGQGSDDVEAEIARAGHCALLDVDRGNCLQQNQIDGAS